MWWIVGALVVVAFVLIIWAVLGSSKKPGNMSSGSIDKAKNWKGWK